MKDISIITVTWNSSDKILEQMESIVGASNGVSWEQMIIDNASTDDTVKRVHAYAPAVPVTVNKQNQGFAAANNQAFIHATGTYVFFLNPDIRLSAGSLKELCIFMEAHQNAGIVGIQLVDETGQPRVNAYPRRFPRLRDVLVIFFKLSYLFPRLTGRYLMNDFDPTREQQVDSVRGSCMFVRREFLDRLGFAFDPRYFIWFEDVDLCREARKYGYEVWYTPTVAAIDYVGQSFKQRSLWWKQWQFFRSACIYFLKWGI